jgi:hypothetical protein
MDIQKAEPHGTGEPQGTGSPISRRTVVAVGVAAAWTIPLIQLATAAPASAFSASFSTALGGAYEGKPQRPAYAPLDISGAVTIGGGVSSIMFTLSIIVPGSLTGNSPTTLSGSTSWVASGLPPTQTGNGSNATFTFVFTATLSSGATASLTGIKLNLKKDDLIGANLITATVSSSGNPSLATSTNTTAIPAAI